MLFTNGLLRATQCGGVSLSSYHSDTHEPAKIILWEYLQINLATGTFILIVKLE